MARPSLFALLLLLVPLGIGCSTTQFTVLRRSPAEVDIPAGKRMAVTPLAGKGGAALAHALTEALFSARRFQLVDRQHYDAALAELKFSAEHVSDQSALSFGNMTGAATLVTGEVERANYAETLRTQTHKCSDTRGKLVPCTHYTRTATFELRALLKVIETETGQLLAAKTLSAQQTKRIESTEREPPALDVEEKLFVACRAEIAQAFVRVVAPHEKQERVVLEADGALPELATGNNYAKIGRWPEAIASFRGAVEKAEALEPAKKAKALYNLGVGLGYSGEFDAGLAELERAYALDPETDYLEQIEVIRRFKAEAARLARQDEAGSAP